MTLRAVIFDMDDTLIDWTENSIDWRDLRRKQIRPMYEYLAGRGYLLPSLEEMANTYDDFKQAAWENISGPEWFSPNSLDTLRATFEEYSLNVDTGELPGLLRLFEWGPMPGERIFPDAVTVLQEIVSSGLRTGLLTNASSPMWLRDRELEALGLLEYLQVRMTAGDVGHLKPHPRAFLAILEAMNLMPGEAIYVGDRLRDDIEGAQGVGMRAIWVRRANSLWMDTITPDATIDSLTELLETLDIWHPGWRNSHHVD